MNGYLRIVRFFQIYTSKIDKKLYKLFCKILALVPIDAKNMTDKKSLRGDM